MESITRLCDYPITRGRKRTVCGTTIPADDVTSIEYRSTTYELDLCDEHKTAMDEALAFFLDIARPVHTRFGREVRKAMRGKGSGKPFTSADVRRWYKEQYPDRELSSTGRLPEAVVAEYANAH